jgi:hypothetical protein
MTSKWFESWLDEKLKEILPIDMDVEDERAWEDAIQAGIISWNLKVFSILSWTNNIEK